MEWKIGNWLWLAREDSKRRVGFFRSRAPRKARCAFFHALAHPFLVLDKGVKLKAVLPFLLKKWNIKKSRCLICSTPDSQDVIKSVADCLYVNVVYGNVYIWAPNPLSSSPVRIPGFHPGDPGSNPGNGSFLFHILLFQCFFLFPIRMLYPGSYHIFQKFFFQNFPVSCHMQLSEI